MRTYLKAGTLLVTVFIISLGAHTSDGTEAQNAPPARLDAEDARQRDQARREMIETRRRTIETLIRLAGRDPTDVVQEYVKFDAIRTHSLSITFGWIF